MAVLNPNVAELFRADAGWHIQIANERRLELGSAVFLLRGASRPAVLSFREGEFRVDMLATPEPTKAGSSPRVRERAWPSVLSALSGETDGLVNLKLSWDPFRKPLPSEVSRYAPTPNHPVIQWEAMVESLRDRITRFAAATSWRTYSTDPFALKSCQSAAGIGKDTEIRKHTHTRVNQ